MEIDQTDNYYLKIKEFYKKQEEIQTRMKNIINNFNVFESNDIKNLIVQYKKELKQYNTQYMNSTFVSNLSDRDYRNRKSELDDLIRQSQLMQNNYNNFLNKQFGPDFSENDFHEKEFDDPQEKLAYEKKKLQDQDNLIDYMIGINKENRTIGKEIYHDLESQEKDVDKMDNNMDKIGSKMDNTNKKMENFLAKSSYCKLYFIIIVQGLIILFLLIF